MPANRKRILVFADWFEPAFKAGGPIRSCVNFAEYMRSDYDVFVFTGDRDLGDRGPYRDVILDKWVVKDQHLQLFYASSSFLNSKNIKALIDELSPDYIYLNSMFSKYFSVYPLFMKWRGKIKGKVILAPRGMLKDSALKFKPLKKSMFIRILRIMQVQRYITFQATDSTEVNDVKKHFGENAKVTYISNFPGIQKSYIEPVEKKEGMLKMIFVGRIHPIKNLYFLLQLLQEVKVMVELTIVGTIEDSLYWEKCSKLIQTFRQNISVKLINDVPHLKLEKMLMEQHLFCLPTLGENFGHAIFEALAVGRPVLISDQTPWTKLAMYQAGWDIELGNSAAFVNIIETVAAMSQVELNKCGKHAWQYCNDYIHQSDIKQQYFKLFN